MNPVVIVGEMAGTHDLNYDSAVELIRVADQAGCDGVKMQFCSNPARMAQRRNIPDASGYRRLAFSAHWLPALRAECEKRKLQFLMSVFLPEDVAIVAPHVNALKIASLESGDKKIVRTCIETGLPVFISTGCMNQALYHQIKSHYECLSGWNQLVWMHSTSAYPVRADQINLRCIADGFEGYSDQTGKTMTGALAIASGAKYLEVHYKFPGTLTDNPDFGHSLTPEKLTEYVKLARLSEIICGDGIKRIQPSEIALEAHRVKG